MVLSRRLVVVAVVSVLRGVVIEFMVLDYLNSLCWSMGTWLSRF